MTVEASPSLRALLAGLRPGTMTLHAGDPDVPVAEPVVCDPDDLRVVRPGDLVLAVGAHGRTRDVLSLLRRAREPAACSVVVAADEPPPEDTVTAADEVGVALLTVPTDVSWGRLYALL